MSYERHGSGYGGGGRRRRRDDYDHYDRREAQQSPDQKVKADIIKYGEVDAEQELPQIAAKLRSQEQPNIPAIAEGFRLAVTEQPYKIPFYAALLYYLSIPAAKEETPVVEESITQPPLGRLVLDDFWKGFQAYLDKLAWRETRLCIHFFAHLTVANLISPQSMLGLLQSFTAVLDEFGVSNGRAKRAARCAAEGLMRAGQVLKEHNATAVIEMIAGIHAYNDSVKTAKWLVHPLAHLHSSEVSDEHADEMLDCAVSALKTLDLSDFIDVSGIFPQLYAAMSTSTVTPFDLPSILVPPEVIELAVLASESSEDAPIKKEEWPEYMLRLFDNDVTADPKTPAGYAVRADLLDIIEIFEVNRKECARVLVEYPKWIVKGTFKPRPSDPTEVPDRITLPGRDWQLESTLIETILGSHFLLPDSAIKPIYYIALITELCKLSPQTVGPAVGKSIRKLYGYCANGLDVEVLRRFAEWFSVHMSNFGFQWVWKEWAPDLALPMQHPKRVFVHRALELEVRLSYYDRVLKTLPEPFQDPSAGAMPDQAPGPTYEYEDATAPHYDAAQSILNQLRSRAKPEDVLAHLETVKNSLAEMADVNEDPDTLIRSIAIQSLLHIGARSFSHFLNAVERYLTVLRALSGSSEAKTHVLELVASFWQRSHQMVGIVFDKLMQYQIVEPADVVGWVFAHSSKGLDWDLLRSAVDKANGRVVVARRRVATLRKEDDDAHARAKAKANGGVADAATMEVDAETMHDPQVTQAEDSPQLVSALKAYEGVKHEQKSTLAHVLEGFVHTLHGSSEASRRVIAADSWEGHTSWGDEEWVAWRTWMWYKHFCRLYSPYLRSFVTTLSAVSFASLESSSEDGAMLIKRIWWMGTAQE
ncbi:MIF4G like-domain-containing protein [Russula earlei]|uniref:MIF4G like-domain-containing protein n=1 Tax=Russula earlei TaxID=71964 RepID=A0ACC0UJR0_9AGAM|nr:MIF4G like-domain-containing protein [Russula earlei]